MELALNLAWFIIACSSYVWLARRFVNMDAEQPRGPSRLQCTVALTCALAILFPVISLTDDLNEMQATLEEASPSRLVIKKGPVSDPATPGPTLAQLFVMVPAVAVGIGWAVLGSVSFEQSPHKLSRRHVTPLGRAPPFFTVPQIG